MYETKIIVKIIKYFFVLSLINKNNPIKKIKVKNDIIIKYAKKLPTPNNFEANIIGNAIMLDEKFKIPYIGQPPVFVSIQDGNKL